jgi:tetratricopeptide (TPR) repeat protein
MQKLSDLERDQRNKDRIDMLGNRANAEMADGNYRGAISDLNDAITLCGHCELLQPLEKNIGLAYCHAGQLDFGEQALKIAQSLRPDDASVKTALEIVRQQRSQALGEVQ